MFGRIKSAKPVAAVAVGVAAVLVLGGGSAVAKTFITGADVKNGSLHMIDLSSSAQRALHGDNGATGATGAKGATGAAGANGATGAKGATGANGATGAKGDAGAAGAQGATGAVGADGDAGTAGANGAVGPQGAAGVPGANAPAAQYGVATVNVKRGTGNASAWATYSTLLGSPVGDTTGGSFRFTCSVAPCTVAVTAAALGTGSVKVYPRVLIMRQDLAGGPSSYCEYGDGSTGAVAATITKQPSSAIPTYSAMKVNIGGSADCGGPDTASGDVDQITVPSGYYDVQSSFVFLS
jgi:Collagen triple helix repeat (20 copies)